MKPQVYLYGLLIIAFGIALFFWGRSTKQTTVINPDNTKQIVALQDSISALQEKQTQLAVEDSLKEIEINSLRKIIAEAKPDSHIPEIDSAISKDSTKAIAQFKLQLNNLDVQTSPGNYVSFSEYGFAAKFLSEVPGLRLKVKNYEALDSLYQNTLAIKRQEISNLNWIVKAKDDLNALTKVNLDHYKDAFEQTESFWYDRFNLSISTGLFYNGVSVFPGIGISAGVALWRSK